MLKPLMASAVFDWTKIEVKPTPAGACRNFFDRPTATLANFECHVTTLNPGESPHPPHRHPDEELIIIKDGTLEVTINERLERAGAGSILFYASNDLHGVRNVGAGSATYYVFRWISPGLASGPAGG